MFYSNKSSLTVLNFGGSEGVVLVLGGVGLIIITWMVIQLGQER